MYHFLPIQKEDSSVTIVTELLDEGEEGMDLWLGMKFCSTARCAGIRRIYECRQYRWY